MASAFGTETWALALRDEINGSSEFRNAGARWGDGFNGNMLFVFESDDFRPKTEKLLIRLDRGCCGGVQFVDGAGEKEAGFVLRAPFTLWKEILDRKTMAATAILTGRMRVDGEKMTLLKHTAAHRALVHCACSVDTNWAES